MICSHTKISVGHVTGLCLLNCVTYSTQLSRVLFVRIAVASSCEHAESTRLCGYCGKCSFNTRLIQKVPFRCKKESSKFSYKILLLSDSRLFDLFFHIFAAIIEALIVAKHKILYTLIEYGRLRPK